MFSISGMFFSGCQHLLMTGMEKSMQDLEKSKTAKLKDCFSEPKVRELCLAIDKQDTGKMKTLIAGGADVNAVAKQEIGNTGKFNRIPLLMYAFPFGETGVRCLLEHEADPNVYIALPERGDNPNPVIFKEYAIERAVSASYYGGYTELLLKCGADPELPENPLLLMTARNTFYEQKEAGKPFSLLVLLVQSGADLNRAALTREESFAEKKEWICNTYAVPAAAKACSFHNLLYLLESGAAYDPKTLSGGGLHQILYEYKQKMPLEWTADQRQCFDKVILWLENKGISFDEPLPPGTIKPEPFRVNNKLIEMRKKNAGKQKAK
jgi:hypothetical protein